jgi:transposase
VELPAGRARAGPTLGRAGHADPGAARPDPLPHGADPRADPGGQRLQKVLEDTGSKLGTVASEVLGASGRVMLDGLVAGANDPAGLAELAKGRLRAKLAALREAWEGRFGALPRCCWASCWPSGGPGRSRRAAQQPGRPGGGPVLAAAGPAAHHPGVSQRTAEVILAEIGLDMAQSPRPGTWPPGLGVPGQQGVGRQAPHDHHPKGSRWLRVALIEAANAAPGARDLARRPGRQAEGRPGAPDGDRGGRALDPGDRLASAVDRAAVLGSRCRLVRAAPRQPGLQAPPGPAAGTHGRQGHPRTRRRRLNR